MSGLQSDAANSRKYDVAPACSASGKITRHGKPLGADSTRPNTATARSSVRSPTRFERLAEVQSTSRIHFDFTPDDQQAEVDRLLALGARHVDVGQGEETWVVLADPEGNEFCILSARP